MTALPAAFLGPPLAHRGLHDMADGRPENSRAAVRAAVAAGYGIEVDIQPAADGTPVVFHDYTLDRMTEASGPVAERSVAELGRLWLTGAEEGVPTLADVLTDVAGKVPLLIEIKTQPAAGPLERAVAEVLRGYDGPVALMSFDPASVAACSAAAPEVPRGLTTCDFAPEDWPELSPTDRAARREIAAFDQVGASFISHQADDLRRPRVAALKAQGAAVLCWTIRSPEAEAAARKIAHNITFEGYMPTG